MPTIEVISVDNAGQFSVSQSDYEFAIIQERKLRSHRALFSKYLKGFKGTIIHIGSPEFKDNYQGFFFAGELIDWEFEEGRVYFPLITDKDAGSQWWGSGQMRRFKFKDVYYAQILDVIQKSLNSSRQKLCFFLTDIQFGPESGKVLGDYEIHEFDEIHNGHGLEWNCLYRIKGPTD